MEYPESTVEISVNNTKRPVNYTMFSSNSSSVQEVADSLVVKLNEYESVSVENNLVSLNTSNPSFDKEEVPLLSNVLWELMGIDFYDYSLSDEIDGCFTVEPDYIPLNQEEWEGTPYDASRPTAADVIATYLSLLYASKGNNIFAPGKNACSIGEFLSEERFERDVEIGMMLTFRDAFSTATPKTPFTPAYLYDSEKEAQNAIENTLDHTLTETELHGLFLCTRDKTNCLRAASEMGQSRIIEDSLTALEEL